MPEQWTGILIGEMHNAKVYHTDLAEELNCSRGYVSMILNGTRSPAGAKERFRAAFERVLEKRRANEA